MKHHDSIFAQYYTDEPFVDRFQSLPVHAVDVIIPVIHTTELWEPNLYSIYREVPVNRLLISDGGCTDDSIAIVSRYPRVEVYDHRAHLTLGYCLRKLIEQVKTEWFVYLHSDVYLPAGWFDAMHRHQSEYDWFGCPQQITALVEYHNADKMFGETRPCTGSQMGRREAFRGIEVIDDDFVYRQEEEVLAGIVDAEGFRHGRVEDTFHYHQLMRKETPWARQLKRVSVEVEWDPAEQTRAATMQVRGILKYLVPSTPLRREIEAQLMTLLDLDQVDHAKWAEWVAAARPEWRSVVNWQRVYWKWQLRKRVRAAARWARQ
jgi:glycosyltransferase involved in cell wall biosynthesis